MANISATLCSWPRAIFSSRLSLAHVSKRSFASIIFILQKERTLLDDKAVLELKNPWQGKRRCKKRKSMNMKIAMPSKRLYFPPSNVTFPRSATEVSFVIDVYNATGTKTVVLGTYTGNLILSFAAVQFYSYLLSHSVSDSHQEATVD